MKKFTINLILLISTILVQGQNKYEVRIDTINKIDEFGFKNGVWKEYWFNGKLHNQFNYVNGKRDGEYLFYETNGELREIGFFQNDKEVGWTLEFRGNRIWRSRYYFDSIRHPYVHDYYENQFPKTGGNYTGISGQLIEYFENGNIMSITTYSNSNLEGYYSEFHFNGQLKEHGINKLNVPWTIYGAYDSLGNAIDIGNLLNGSGTIRKFYSNGKLMKIEQYNDGKYWNTILLYSISGNLLDPGSIKDGNGEAIEYYESGVLKSKTHFKNGVRNGNYIEYDQKEVKRLFGNYVNGQRNGDWEVFNENGSIQVIYHYEKGKVDRVTDYW